MSFEGWFFFSLCMALCVLVGILADRNIGFIRRIHEAKHDHDRFYNRYVWERARDEVEMQCLRDDVVRLYNAAVAFDPTIPLKGPSWNEKWIPWVNRYGAGPMTQVEDAAPDGGE